VAADKKEARREAPPRLNRQVDHFRDVGQIVEGESYGFGSPLVEETEVVRVACNLQINKPHGVPGLARGGCNQFKTERFQAKVHL
jgi:hypothetical protein